MKKNSGQSKKSACITIVTLLISGCSRNYQAFSEPAIATAMVIFIAGIVVIKLSNVLFNIEKFRVYLQRSASLVKKSSILIGVIAIALFIYGFTSENLMFYNSYLGVILLYISNRLYVSTTAWLEGDWDSAALNYKLIAFSFTIFFGIFFLIYLGRRTIGF